MKAQLAKAISVAYKLGVLFSNTLTTTGDVRLQQPSYKA